jgi:hypothetical protein
VIAVSYRSENRAGFGVRYSVHLDSIATKPDGPWPITSRCGGMARESPVGNVFEADDLQAPMTAKIERAAVVSERTERIDRERYRRMRGAKLFHQLGPSTSGLRVVVRRIEADVPEPTADDGDVDSWSVGTVFAAVFTYAAGCALPRSRAVDDAASHATCARI